MAIYHFHAQMIKRSEGRSSVAAAAYRAGERMTDARTGFLHDFSLKGDVIDSAILLPEGAPEAFLDRETLWNAVELSEKRKDAQVARELNISLPRELSDAENWQLACDFVQKEFVSRGMIADVAFHRGHGGPNEEQPHMHILLTTRRVSEKGFGQKERDWNETEELLEWRKDWADFCNTRMATLGHDMRIDHRTLEEQGLNLEPHHYRSGMVDKRTGEKFQEYADRAQRNGERLMDDPSIALKALTQQQSTFTHQDVARFVHRNSVDAEQFNTIYAKVLAHEQLVSLGRDAAGRDRFTTKEMAATERNLVEIATRKANESSHRVSLEAKDKVAQTHSTLSQEQKEALDHITKDNGLACVVGFAGTGKSYMLGAAKVAFEASGYRVQGMALAGIAAEQLQNGSGISCNTLANRLWMWGEGKEHLTAQDILIVDEAGMIGSKQMEELLAFADAAGAKVILVGDPRQLQAIDAGASFRAILERLGFVEITDIRRQNEDWQKQATRDFAVNKTKEGLWAYDRHDNVHAFETKSLAIATMIENWDESRLTHPDKTQIMFAFRRAEVKELNETARTIRKERGELGEDKTVMTSVGERTFAEGDRVYFLKNEKKALEVEVKNGRLGTIEKIAGENFTVKLDSPDGKSQQMVTFNMKDYNAIDHGYAATVHKSQGVTVDKSYVLASKGFDSHLTYVSMSRHRETADMYYSKKEFATFNELTSRLSWEKSKDTTLDYESELEDKLDKDKSKESPLKQFDRRKESVKDAFQERLNVAEKRHEQRIEAILEKELKKEQNKDLERIGQARGYPVSLDIKAGDYGVYRGIVEVAGRSYGLIEDIDGKSAKLIPAQQLESRERGQMMLVQNQRDKTSGRESLKAIQPKVQEREKERARDQDQGLSY